MRRGAASSVDVRPLAPEDHNAWSSLRYRVAVEQLGRESLPGIDHGRRAVQDELDGSAHTLGAYHGDVLIGGVRSHYFRDVPNHPLFEGYAMGEVDAVERDATSVTTHLMIEEDWRSRGVALVLIASMFEYNVANGMRYDRIDVIPENQGLFERMGYCRSGPDFPRDGFGLVIPMRLDTEDDAHLNRCRSPLRRGRRSRQMGLMGR